MSNTTSTTSEIGEFEQDDVSPETHKRGRMVQAVFWVVLLGFLAVAPFFLYPVFVMQLLCFALFAAAFNLLIGFTGLLSFGHAAYLGLGAYAVGILADSDIWAAWISFPVAVLVSGLFALVTGAISLRTRGVYFIMITLAFGQMAYFTATSLSAYGGDDGLTLWSRSEFFGTALFSDDTSFYYLVFGVLLAVTLLLKRIAASRFGRVLTGAKQSEARLHAIGIDPYRYRLAAYVIAG
ncbi:branched-chain amino acid ABC transporter permease, partial [Thioclava electrotropha]|uniref:branched-chain amino acid ABC transporter permease n=1 Tax=Thioclava electrotropha TaxID=1549850 RepID=UPI0023A8E1A6